MERTRYKILESLDEIKLLVKACQEVGYASVDFETSSTKIYTDAFYPTILSVTFQPGQSCIIPLNHQDSPLKESWLSCLKYFGQHVIENPKITKFAQNWKFDNQIFRKYGIFSRGTVIDSMLAKYLLNEERPHGLKEMVDIYLPAMSGYENDPEFAKAPWDKKPLKPLAQYAACDTDATFRLCVFLESKLIKLGFYTLYRNLIMPASITLQGVERRGLAFDKEFNTQLSIKYTKLIDETKQKLKEIPKVKRYEIRLRRQRINDYITSLEEKIDSLKGDPKATRKIALAENKIIAIQQGKFTTKNEQKLIEPLNFGSGKQLISLLFTHPKGLKYPILQYTKDKKKRPTTTPSTAEDALINLLPYDKYGFINTLLELRGYEHNNSAFIQGYQDLIQSDGRIHPKYNIHGTVTGRLSSSEPNAQQIPKKEVNPDIKKQFIAPPGHLILGGDYGQAELRMMAYLAKEDTLLEAFRLNRDPHLSVACKKYSCNYEEVVHIYEDETHPEYKLWKVRRKQAKQIVFGCIYGIEAKKLAEQLSDQKSGLVYTKEQAQVFLDEFFESFPKVKKYMMKQKRTMEKNGFIYTLFGRKRRCPNIYSDNYGSYLEAVRASFNTPSQSAASDMALFASIIIDWDMHTGKLPPVPQVSTVHDALYYYALPQLINPWTIYQIYLRCKNPDTKRYFGFEIKEVDMAMDFTIGKTMIDELPYNPVYDYNRFFDGTFDLDEYYREHAKVRHIGIDDYPKAFPAYFTKDFVYGFKETWTKYFHELNIG